MPVDRDAALKQAEKLLRQGKLDGAIAEYVRLVEDQPRDWNAINALGDLYARAGDPDRAVAQFTRIADYLYGEGFFPKAAALYKTALKVRPEHEHTLLRLSETAAQQGLLADARAYLRQLGRQRRDRGDSRGAAECLVRLALLDEADADSVLAGARAAHVLGDAARAIALFKEAARALAKGGRGADAVEALAEAAALDPDDRELRRQLAKDSVAAGQIDRARTYLTRESAGSDPDLLLALGRMELAAGNDDEARSVFTHVIAIAPHRGDDILQVAAEWHESGDWNRAFACTEIVVDDALLAADWDRALQILHRFLQHGPRVPALVKLVELAVDAGRDDVMYDAQAALADAYLADGRGGEARVIAEDLLAREPESAAHADRLRRALTLTGVADPESVIGRYREGGEGAEPIDLDFSLEPAAPSDSPPVRPSPPIAPAEVTPEAEADGQAGAVPEAPDGPLSMGVEFVEVRDDPRPSSERAADEAFVLDRLEIDLSDVLAGLGAAIPVPPANAPAEEPIARTPDLETVFEQMRQRAEQEPDATDASAHYERGLQYLAQDRIEDGIAELQAAARTPLLRFAASSRVGRLLVARGDLKQGVEWLERAAEALPPGPEDGLAVLYDLAGALEGMGESARALAVLMEIDVDGGGYRDVRQRIEQLSRAQTESPQP